MDCTTRMREARFDVGDDDVLVYLDPTIGRYENAKFELAVRLAPGGRQLELHVRGCVAAKFDLEAGVARACMDASASCFSTLAELGD